MYQHDMENEYSLLTEAEKKVLYEPFITESMPEDISPAQQNEDAYSIHLTHKKTPHGSDDRHITELLKEALIDEKSDAAYYANLMNEVHNPHDKEIIRGIRNDELKHYKMIESVYRQVTGKTPPDLPCENKMPTGDLPKDFERRIFEELEGSTFYRKLYFSFSDTKTRDLFYEIITDEQCHAAKFNYLYSKYKHMA